MNRTVNIVIQMLALAAQVANFLLPVLKEEHKIYATAAIAGVQGVTGILAHNFNPDATPARVAYEPNKP